MAWIIGARLAQLPHRDWPVLTEGVELPGRRMARIVTVVTGYRLWRQRQVQRRPGTETTSTRATHQSHPLARLPRRMPYLHRHGARPTDPAVRQRRLIHDQSLDRHRILGQPDHLDMKTPAANEAKAGTNE